MSPPAATAGEKGGASQRLNARATQDPNITMSTDPEVYACPERESIENASLR